MLDGPARHQIVGGRIAAVETRRVGDHQAHVFVLGHLHQFEPFPERAGGRRQLQNVKFPAECGFQMLGARVNVGRQEQAVELVLDDELAIIAVGLTLVFCRGLFGLLSVLVGDSPNLEAAGRGGRPQQVPAAIVETDNGGGESLRRHRLPCPFLRP
jgi:hypothetical protein